MSELSRAYSYTPAISDILTEKVESAKSQDRGGKGGSPKL